MRLKLGCKKCRRNIEIEGELLATKSVACPNCGAQLEIPTNILNVDQMLGGFRIKKHLGSGSMGCVYLATQLSMDRQVALKVLPPEMTKQKDDLERFFHEVRTLAKFDHPNVVTALEAGEDHGNYYMAMTYVEGETLEEYLDRGAPMEEYDALQICLRIADALKYAWERHQLLHRDVKPANVMVDRNREPKLLDMGISKRQHEMATSSSGDGFLVGTPHYMSPEQAKSGDRIDFRSDMYGLGCTLYHLVAGRVPYDGATVMDVLTKHALDPFPSPQKLNPKVSDECTELLRKMMAKQAKDRHATWDDLMLDVRRVLKGAPPKGVRATHTGDTLGRSKGPVVIRSEAVRQHLHTAAAGAAWKRWLLLALVAAAAALIVIAAVKVSQDYREHQRQKDDRDASGREANEQRSIQERDQRLIEARRRLEEERRRRLAVPRPAGEDPAQRLRDLKSRYESAQLYEQNNPQAFTAAIKAYELVLAAGAGTEYEALARAAAARLTKVREDNVREVMAQLTAAAERATAARDYRKAAAIYADYQGVCADDTKAARDQRVAELLAEDGRQALANAEGAQRLDAFGDDVAHLLLKQDLGRVRQLVAEAGRDPTLSALSAWPALRGQLEGALDYERAILDGFKAEVGKEVTVGLTKGHDTLFIQAVKGDEVEAMKQVTFGAGTGRFKANFRVGELFATERLRRLEGQDAPALQVMRGVLWLEASAAEKTPGAVDKALACFKGVPPPLGEALTFAAVNPKGGNDAAAEAEFKRLLQVAGVSAGPADAMTAALERVALGAANGLELKTAVPRFLRRYGESKVVAANRGFLLVLETIASSLGRPTLTAGRWAEVLAELRKVNGGAAVQGGFTPVTGGAAVDLHGNRELSKLDPLRGLGIVALDLSGTGVRDLAPLASLPLRTLNLANTPVDNLVPLRTTRLTRLDLSGTRVENLKGLEALPLLSLTLTDTPVARLEALAKLPLVELYLGGCTAVKSFAPVAELPQLERLACPKGHPDLDALRPLTAIKTLGYTAAAQMPAATFWKQLDDALFKQMADEFGPKLRTALREIEQRNPRLARNGRTFYSSSRFTRDGIALDLSGNQGLQAVDPLKGLPICDFAANGTGLTSVAPFKGAPLKRLSVAQTSVRSLDGLEGAPLQYVDLRGTGVTDFDILKNWPLTQLHLSGEAVKRLDFLKGKALEALTLEGTLVKDLGVLKDMPLRALGLSNTPIVNLSFLKDLSKLETLDLSGTSVKELSYLKHCPLKSLNLTGIQVASFGVLRELPLLESLTVTRTGIKSLTPVKELKLVYLDASNTDIRSLEPLAGMPLRTLYVRSTKIDDVDDLRGMKLVTLHLSGTDIKDIGPLRNMPLVELRLDGCEKLTDFTALRDIATLRRLAVPKSFHTPRVVSDLAALEYVTREFDNGWVTTKADFLARP